MSFIKKALALALCAAMLLCFAACGGKDGEKEAVETTWSAVKETNAENQEVSEIQGKSPEYITPREIYMANTVDYLLSIYKTIKITCEYDTAKDTKYIFLKKGIPVFIEENRPYEDEPDIWCWYNGFNIRPEDDGTVIYFSAYELPDSDSEFPYQYMIADNVTGDINDYIGEEDGCYKFRATGSDEDIKYEEYHFFDKETLAVRKSVCKYDEEKANEIYFTYDEPVEKASMLDPWDGKLKKVTVVNETSDGSGRNTVTKEYSIPADWEMIPYEYEEVVTYLDEDLTVPYEYPGNGVDYTIYVTDSMG